MCLGLIAFCSIPFSLDDISKSMQNVEVAEVDPPPLIRQNSNFMFLLERSDWSSQSSLYPIDR